MRSVEDVLKYAEAEMAKYNNIGERPKRRPIYSIVLLPDADKEIIYPSGKHSGFPDTSGLFDVGYYFSIQEAVTAMHVNALDIRETVYNAGFVVCRFPGLYDCPGPEARIFFRWSEEKQGFFEAEEPPLFGHISI